MMGGNEMDMTNIDIRWIVAFCVLSGFLWGLFCGTVIGMRYILMKGFKRVS